MSGDTVPFDQSEEITRDAIAKFVEGYFSEKTANKEEAEVWKRHFLLYVGGLILLVSMKITMNCKYSMSQCQCWFKIVLFEAVKEGNHCH